MTRNRGDASPRRLPWLIRSHTLAPTPTGFLRTRLSRQLCPGHRWAGQLTKSSSGGWRGCRPHSARWEGGTHRPSQPVGGRSGEAAGPGRGPGGSREAGRKLRGPGQALMEQMEGCGSLRWRPRPEAQEGPCHPAPRSRRTLQFSEAVAASCCLRVRTVYFHRRPLSPEPSECRP